MNGQPSNPEPISQNQIKTPLKHRLMLYILLLLAKLPLSWSRKIGRFFGRISGWLGSKQKHFIETNLAHCFPTMNALERDTLTHKTLLSRGQLAAELAVTWLWSPQKLCQLPIETQGLEHLKKAFSKQKGVMILTPHLGNWELFFPFLVNQFPLAAMYKPARMKNLDTLILRQREENGGDVYAADGRGVRQMIKALKNGKVTFLLPDQEPARNAGIFAPFFNRPAWTMTLPGRLYQSTGCEILFACSLQTKQGFKVVFRTVETIYPQMSTQELAEAINQQMEQLILLAPEQYQWSYKRFYYQPEGKPQIYL